MVGRKVATYSRRKPFASVREESQAEPTKVSNDESCVAKPTCIEQSSSIPKVESLLASIKELDIEPVPPAKSRKSEIRPRLSVAPSQFEFHDLLSRCGQVGEIPFSQWLSSTLEKWPLREKIGESSFSEVFKLSHGKGEAMAVKIMPLLRPGESPSTETTPEPIQLTNLLHEIQALQALETLRAERKYAVPSGHTGFNRLQSCTVVSGEYPLILLEEWDRWNEAQGTFNDRPTFYGQDSLHVVLVMEFGGLDLEHFTLSSIARVKSVLLQIISAVALAEEKLEFEHRDLHLGNVLVKESHREDIRLGNYQGIPTAGIVTSIIDCSLSRFRDDKGLFFRDLSRDDWLFTGDEKESRQYQVYRDMKALLQSDWDEHNAKSNLLWIAYMAEELLAKYEKLRKKEPILYESLLQFSQRLKTFSSTREAFNHLYLLK